MNQPAPDRPLESDQLHAPTSTGRKPTAWSLRPKWHLIYFVLAAFDLLAVALGFYLSHRITGIYADSVAANQEWAERLGQYDHLRRLAGAVNAPGNNVFDSQHIAAESTALRDATREFAGVMTEARADLTRHVPRDTATLLLADLTAIDVAMNDMTGEAELIFSYFQRREPAKAGARMATMDRKYDVVHRAFGVINEHVRAVQAANFHRQIAAARSLQRFEWVIGALILLMVGGATAYGHLLSRQAAALVEEREREQRLQARLASEQRFRSLIERGSDIIVILDEGHIARYVGPSVVRVLGYQVEALVGNPVGTFIHPDDAARVNEYCTLIMSSPGTQGSIRLQFRHSDGTWRTLEAIGYTTRDAAGGTNLILNARDVTEHARSEERLRQSEARFHSIFQHAALGMVLVAADGMFRQVNPTFCRFVGYSEDELLRMSVPDITHPDDVEETRHHIKKMASQPGEVLHFVKRYRRKDGGVVWGQLTVVSLADAPNGPVYFATLVQDITERKIAETALEENRRFLATLVTNLPGMVYRGQTDPEWTMVFVSEGTHALTGYTRAELEGHRAVSYREMVHPDDRERLWIARRTSLDARSLCDQEYRLITKTGDTRWVWERAAGLYDPDGALAGIEGFITDITERRRAEDTIRTLAYYDPLTTLPNRALLQDRLARALVSAQRANTRAAFLLMDLNHFKDINNTLGHHHGDELLRQLGSRLQEVLRESDTVARMGGDEFAVLLPDTSADGALKVATKIEHALTIPFVIDGLTITVEASIGIALFPDHGDQAETLIRLADVAMYGAKQAGGGHAVYASEHDHYSPRRLALMGELRYAIEHDELTLAYQPKVHLQTRRVIGVEALVRWNHPHRGVIPPDDFIPLAERSGLIKPLTLRVLTMALDQAQAWHRAGFLLNVAVNLSARNLMDPELPDQVAELLRSAGAIPERLELEITESTIMADPVRALDVLTRLHQMQVSLTIDDFGTGYSSLGYLKRLPVSTIKIDKSFVRNMATDDNDAVIVRSTIELVHNLGLVVVAEGVETSYIWERLASLGCDAAQGYYMAMPMPAADLTQWFHDCPWQVAMAVDRVDAEAA